MERKFSFLSRRGNRDFSFSDRKSLIYFRYFRCFFPSRVRESCWLSAEICHRLLHIANFRERDTSWEIAFFFFSSSLVVVLRRALVNEKLFIFTSHSFSSRLSLSLTYTFEQQRKRRIFHTRVEQQQRPRPDQADLIVYYVFFFQHKIFIYRFSSNADKFSRQLAHSSPNCSHTHSLEWEFDMNFIDFLLAVIFSQCRLVFFLFDFSHSLFPPQTWLSLFYEGKWNLLIFPCKCGRGGRRKFVRKFQGHIGKS